MKEVETSFAKYLAPQYDKPLPAATAKLIILPAINPKADHEKQHVRRCPHCHTLYRYIRSHEYMVNGCEDEEELARMSPPQATAFYLEQAVLLEKRRREIDDLQGAAGNLGDYIDHGNPSPAEEKEAYDFMERHRQDADSLRAKLQVLVETLRRDGPEILAVWANAHARVCCSFLHSLPDKSDDDKTARYVARTTLEAWEKLPSGGETFIAINTAWLEGYLELLGPELGIQGQSS
ncbi:MAG: hypothetical protein NTW95_05085 [Candidatus Aminicenantes bacterium]|nr:hypothetical protein [Candidatus Aminicenantes bacterium]